MLPFLLGTRLFCSWAVLHTLLPATTFQFYLAAIPLWGSLVGHYLYALILGLLLARSPFVAAWQAQQPARQGASA
ncbi:MAG TPA: hypothetical protein VF458_23200 [Ktedonobacteraceae bacterium]